MDKLLIRGGRRLQGEVSISGAKNAALPILCASLLSADTLDLGGVPQLQDVATMRKLIRNMGVQIEQSEDGVVRIKLHGACVGCNSSTTTLRNGIERYLRHKLPQVKQVVAE